jgi:predicted RNA-binding Zn-ribbon protein involved in translation (DUF1610 family)
MTKIWVAGMPNSKSKSSVAGGDTLGAELGLCPQCGAVLDGVSARRTGTLYYNISLTNRQLDFSHNDTKESDDCEFSCNNCGADLNYDEDFLLEALKAAEKILDDDIKSKGKK